jgi:serine/threonine protein kinase
VQALYSTSSLVPKYWPSARQFTEAIQCPAVCFSDPQLKGTLPAIDRLGMPLVTSGQFAFVYKVNSIHNDGDFAVRCFRGYLGDRDQRYRAMQRHLKSFPVTFLSDFTYATEGILVAGNGYPILSMKWIEGPTLDLYLEEMIDRKEVLFHLSQEWLKLVASLREAGIAHGDLQHGNIIVERGALRLVDHDGLFVPEMAGWSSSEVGHQHYQHPLRDAEHFNASLDNFSSIVIYLTLISLMERPALWKEHHDENLLFTKSDFLTPASSELFAKIKEIGPEHRRLAEVLEKAATDKPDNVPYLLDLVTIQSSLPSWMTAIELEGQIKTRESKIDPRVRQEQPRWIPKPTDPRPSVPSTPASTTVQTLFGGQVRPAPPYGPPSVTDPTAIWKNTPKFAKDMLGKTFIWWYWGIYVFLKIFGLDFIPAFALAILTLIIFCFTWGFIRSQELARRTLRGGGTTNPNGVLPGSSAPTVIKTIPQPRRTPVSITSADPIIGNTALNIYHLTNCEWVNQIVNKNRITFPSSFEASVAGYKPCRVCSPVQ